MNFGFIETKECVVDTVPPTTDPRCEDEAFRIANPDICPPQPSLILKPSFALTCPLGSVQYKAFLSTNGVEEDVTGLTVFGVSNMDVAVIGAASGNATGLSDGAVTISATYEGMTATGTLTVIGSTDRCCDSIQVGMMVMVDTSRSMSQTFGSGYSTRLDFAKAAANRYITEVNQTKDLIGLQSFNEATSTVLSAPVSDATAVAALIPGIAQTQEITAFYDALQDAITELDNSTASLKVIVLISDGEDTSPGAATGYEGVDNPITLLSNFKDQGGIVICVGCRASGIGYSRLSAFSTGGFLLNAYGDNTDAVLDFLSGLKGYICAGDCTPAGDEIVATPQLDYDAFLNWDITGGHVDLIGPGLFDFLPGNGLYVDLAGSTLPAYGTMTNKTAIAITAGHSYRISLQLAGNQRLDDTPYSVQLRIYYETGGVEILHQHILIDDYTQGFEDYSFNFTAPASGNAFIEIKQNEVPDALTGVKPFFGLLLGKVQFTDTTDLVTKLYDDFDGENLQYVPPKCGLATTYYSSQYAYGYNCYATGCLDEPPTVQLPDPNPLPDIESDYVPPTTYTSTRTACVSCADGFINLPETTLDAPSVYSQTPSTPSPSYFTSVTFDFEAETILSAYQMTQLYPQAPINGWVVEGSNDLADWVTLETVYAPPWNAYSPVAQTGLFPIASTAGWRYVRFTVTPRNDLVATGFNAVQFYGLADSESCATATETSTSSQAAADQAAYAAAYALAEAGLNCTPYYVATEHYTAKCGCGTYGGDDVQMSATGASLISQTHAEDEAKALAQILAEAELDCTGSNNDQKIFIPTGDLALQAGPASPYPSVKYVSGETTSIANVQVVLTGFNHMSLDDVIAILMGPDGTCVTLLYLGPTYNLDSCPTPVDLTFDDSGTTPIPHTLATGTYRPQSFAAGSGALMPAPYCGESAPSSTLAAFNGTDANGAWALWIYDGEALLDGAINGGWDLVIT